MRQFPFTVATVAPFVSTLFLVAASGISSDVSPEELRALDARRALKSCALEVESTYWWKRPSGEENQVSDHRIIYFEGENIRNDKIETYDPMEQPDKRGNFRTISCLVGQEHIHWSDRIFPNGHGHGLTIRARDFEEVQYLRPVDPRIIGLTTTTTLNTTQTHLESILASPNRVNTQVSDTVLNGDACRLVEYERKGPLRMKIWICPGKGDAVLKIELLGKSGGAEYHEISESTVSQVEGTNDWFPTGYHFTRYIDKMLRDKETTSIKIISMNKPLPKDTFTLAGIGVPAGMRIRRVPGPSDGLEEYWDGRQIAIVTPGEEMKIAVGWTWTRILLATVSVLAAAGAAWFILQRTKQYAS